MHNFDGGMLKYSKVTAPLEGEYFVKKRFYDAFIYTELDYLLINLGIKILICVGFLVDDCLFFTLYEAYVHNYKVVLLRDCMFAFEMNDDNYIKNRTRTKHHIETVEIFIGHTATSEEFIESCKNL